MEHIWRSNQNVITRNLVDCFIRYRSIHAHSYHNFNKYLKEMLEMVMVHVKITYVDKYDRKHVIYVRDCNFVKPYEAGFGIDNPEQSFMRGSYEATIEGTLVYAIYEKVRPSEVDSLPTTLTDEQDVPEEDVEDHGMDVDGETSSVDMDDDLFSDEEEENDRAAFFIDSDDRSKSHSVLVEETVYHDFLIADIPVWINSDICNMQGPLCDPNVHYKSYLEVPTFGVSRTMKVLVYDSYLINNRVLALKKNQVEIRSRFYSKQKKYRTNSTLKIHLEQKKLKDSVKSWVHPSRYLVEIPHENPKIYLPVIIVAMAFGWKIVDFITAIRVYLGSDNGVDVNVFLCAASMDTLGCKDQEDAILYIAKHLKKCKTMDNPKDKQSYVSHMLRDELLPNVNTKDAEGANEYYEDENQKKGFLLAQAVATLIRLTSTVNNRKPLDKQFTCDDRRSYQLKRTETPGEKLTILLRKYLKKYVTHGKMKLKNTIENKTHFDIHSILNFQNIKLTASVRSGVWDVKRDVSDSNQNKSQLMTTGYCSDSNHMHTQKIVDNSMRKSVNPESLMIYPDQAGRIDFYLTPESEKCGISRNFALGLVLSSIADVKLWNGVLLDFIRSIQNEIGWFPRCIGEDVVIRHNCFLVHDLFGSFQGWVSDWSKFYEKFREGRRRGFLHRYMGFQLCTKTNCIYFNLDEGRFLRPLVVGQKIPQLMEFLLSPAFHVVDRIGEMLNLGLIEYFDASEEIPPVVRVADGLETFMKDPLSYTHVEVHGCMLLNLTMSKAFCNFNQGPRRMYTGNMEKRSISLKLNIDRGTTASYSLWYAQLPLLSEQVDRAMKLRVKEPNGVNINIAVLCRDTNQEDSWIFKKETFEVGMGVTVEYFIVTVLRGLGCLFRLPGSDCRGKASSQSYHAITEGGYPKVGSFLSGGDCVVGKVFESKVDGQMTTRCISKFLPWSLNYIVTKVERYPYDCEQPDMVRVILAQYNYPSIGDKFYLAHGQKGTCGSIVGRDDMPFYCSGVNAGTSPDLIISVCSLMRVTQGLLLELLIGKGRAFSPDEIEQYDNMLMSDSDFSQKMAVCKKILTRCGLSYKGKDKMICGKTGKLIDNLVFNGIANLRVLKHMAKNKIRSRDRGPTNELTRQTSVGKKHFGGQKAGEMENWNFHGHGISFMFQSINYDSADKFVTFFCIKCQWFAFGCVDTKFFYCKSCKQSGDNILRLNVPYTTCLTFQEMYTAGWGHTFKVSRTDALNYSCDDTKRFAEYTATEK